MHMVLFVLSAVAGIGFWWVRLRAAGTAASEVVNAVGRLRGAARRKKIRRQAQLSPVTAIDDVVVAAATLLTAIAAERGMLSQMHERTISREIGRLTTRSKAEEATLYAKWAAAQIDDATTVINVLVPFLATRLDEAEKRQLIEMARLVLSVDETNSSGQGLLPVVKRKLGLVVN